MYPEVDVANSELGHPEMLVPIALWRCTVCHEANFEHG